MRIRVVGLPAKHHLHDLKSLQRTEFGIKKQPAQGMQIGHADAQHGAGVQYAIKLAQGGRQFVLETQMFEHMRGVDFADAAIGKARQVGAMTGVIDLRTGLDVEDFPFRVCNLAADMQT